VVVVLHRNTLVVIIQKNTNVHMRARVMSLELAAFIEEIKSAHNLAVSMVTVHCVLIRNISYECLVWL